MILCHINECSVCTLIDVSFSHMQSPPLLSLQPTVRLVVTTRASRSWTFPTTSPWHLLPSSQCQCSPKRSRTSTSPCQRTTISTPPFPSPSHPATWSTHASPRPPRTRYSPARPLKPGSRLAVTSKGRPPPRGARLPPCTAPPGDTATPPVGNRA